MVQKRVYALREKVLIGCCITSLIGFAIFVIVQLATTDDIPFFSTNGALQAIVLVAACAGIASMATNNYPLFYMYIGLAAGVCVLTLPSFKMWGEEGSQCSDLSSEKIARGQACYSEYSNVRGTDNNAASFLNFASSIISCYAGNEINTKSSGVCYNIRWTGGTADAVRAFQFISLFIILGSNLAGVILSFVKFRDFTAMFAMQHRIEHGLVAAVNNYYSGSSGKSVGADKREWENTQNEYRIMLDPSSSFRDLEQGSIKLK